MTSSAFTKGPLGRETEGSVTFGKTHGRKGLCEWVGPWWVPFSFSWWQCCVSSHLLLALLPSDDGSQQWSLPRTSRRSHGCPSALGVRLWFISLVLVGSLSRCTLWGNDHGDYDRLKADLQGHFCPPRLSSSLLILPLPLLMEGPWTSEFLTGSQFSPLKCRPSARCLR